MLPWLIAGALVVAGIVTVVLRDAIADDRRRKLDKVKKNYAGY